MKFKYGLDDKPPLIESLLMGLQWCALVVPFMIILGKIACSFHFSDPADQTVYLQKTAFVMAVFLVLEILWGHGLPLVMGPSAVLLIGIISSSGFDMNAISTSIMCGGVVLAITGITGMFGYLQRLFTPRVVAVVLLLIAFTLTPTILKLVTGSHGATPQAHTVYAFALTTAMLLLYRILLGIWKSVLILISMVAGSVLYFIIFPNNLDIVPVLSSNAFSFFFSNMVNSLEFDTGLLISFLICFVALSINDLGSMQSMNAFTKSPNMDKRLNRGIFFTGLANVASGIFGVIGQVNYSVSVGVVTSTGCISRFTLLPAAAILLIISFSPMMIGFLGMVPPVVIGSIMLYILGSQLSAGIMLACEALGQFNSDDGMIVGIPLLVSIVIAFLPADFFQNFPPILQPIAGNAFVMGIIILLFLEHGLFKKQNH